MKTYKAIFKRTIHGPRFGQLLKKEIRFEAKSISQACKLAKDFANELQTGRTERTEILSVEAV